MTWLVTSRSVRAARVSPRPLLVFELSRSPSWDRLFATRNGGVTVDRDDDEAQRDWRRHPTILAVGGQSSSPCVEPLSALCCSWRDLRLFASSLVSADDERRVGSAVPTIPITMPFDSP